MATMERGEVSIGYEIHGDGYPVLLIAPGGMRSAADRWAAAPWNPIEALADEYRVIAMDQRNAGRSRAPVRAGDGWHSYTEDQLALLDYLEIERCHVVGMCIGGPYIVRLINAAGDRVRSSVMLQPIGLADNRDAFYELFDGWRAAIAAAHPEADDRDWAAFRHAMFGGDFMFGARRDEVAACESPILLLMGDDRYHPAAISREVASLAGDVTFIERWKDEDVLAATDATIGQFLSRHTP